MTYEEIEARAKQMFEEHRYDYYGLDWEEVWAVIDQGERNEWLKKAEDSLR